jgi:2-polyprenyl-3-methyl-5-hydroxy-6-metoxy-1,4-benzoquinol methylase
MADQVAAGGWLSPWLRERRVRAAHSYLSKGRVLDVGCGSGTLAQWCATDDYLGVEPDAASLQSARTAHPQHRFQADLPDSGKWDVIILLAVIEHVPQPAVFLTRLRHLAAPQARLVMTTPHPSLGWVHRWGAQFGLFSQAAEEEHETLLDKREVEKICQLSGWRLEIARRFLAGGNQIFVASAEGKCI